MKAFTITQSLDEREWREFVDHHPAGNVFHLPEMQEVYSRTKGYKPVLWAALKRGRPVVLLLLAQITTLAGPLVSRLSTRAVAPGSILCAPEPDAAQALPLLLQAYLRETRPSPLFTELRNLSDLSEIRPLLEENRFAYEDHLNFLIDLDRPPERILEGIGRRTRKHIRRELRSGRVTVEEVRDRESLKSFYGLLQRSYSAARVALADISLFESVFDLLLPRGLARFFMVRVDGEFAACSLELTYKDRIYGWYSGLNRAFGKHNPNELLMWHILQWGASKGFRLYDFGGAGSPGQKYGVRDFKSKFGGELVSFGRNTCFHSPWLFYLSKWGYGGYRRLIRYDGGVCTGAG